MDKRNIILFIILVSVFLTITIPVQAKNTITIEDSKNVGTEIADEIKKQIGDEATDEITKIYNVGILFAFSEYEDIKSILISGEMVGVHYAARTTKNDYTFWIEDETTYLPLNVVRYNQRALDIFHADNVVNYISDKIIVYNRYYLCGESSHMGSAIYYETNKGDYVYFTHNTVGEYLFPIADFCEFQKAVLEKSQSDGLTNGGINYSVWDLSPYDFKSDTFDLNKSIVEDNHGSSVPDVPDVLYIGIGILIALAILAFLYFQKIHVK